MTLRGCRVACLRMPGGDACGRPAAAGADAPAAHPAEAAAGDRPRHVVSSPANSERVVREWETPAYKHTPHAPTP